MRPHQPMGAEPTRAEVARRRLEQLNASFRQVADPVTAEPDEEQALQTDASAPVRSSGQHAAAVSGHSRLSPLHLRLVATVAVAAGVLLTWWVLAERPQVEELEESADLTAPASQESPAEDGTDGTDGDGAAPSGGEVVVDVAGKVEEPGIVVLPEGSRVHEAIEAAGGVKGRADTTSLNLARVLTDGEQVLVGVEPAGPPAAAGSSGSGGVGGASGGSAVNLNTATVEELDTLPGVGPVTAESIVTWRTENGTFSSVDDLLEVSGIGEKTLAELRDRVTV